MLRIFLSALLLALFRLTCAASDLSIATTSLPNGSDGVAYTASVTASGGTQPYTWSTVALGCPTPPCGLPPGLTPTFSPSGVSIAGVPTMAGDFFVIYRVTDSSLPPQTASWSFTITIGPSSNVLGIVTTTLLAGATGVYYSATIEAAGGTPPYAWNQELLPCAVVLMCEVPPGLQVTFNSADVSIAGIPTQVGNFLVAYRITDSGSPPQTAMRTFTISISPASSALAITTSSLPTGVVGAPYSASLSASGGTQPYVWSQVTTIACPALAGVFCELPAGLAVTLGATASIGGSPTKPGQYFVEFQVADSSSPQQSVMHVFTISIAAPAAFFTGQTSLGTGMYYLQFSNGNLFGYYNFPDYPILYHFDMGFEALVDGGNGTAYLYDFSSGHWLYSSSSLFPYLYDFTLGNWLYYFPDAKNPGHYTTNPRYFSNLATGKIITM